jgi:hypothetical protein
MFVADDHTKIGRYRSGLPPGLRSSDDIWQTISPREWRFKWGTAIWGRKVFRARAILFAIGCAAMLSDVSRGYADPISFWLEGKLEAGTDPVTPLEVGPTASLPVLFTTSLANGDTYQIFGFITGSNGGGANFGASEPFSIEYVGNDGGNGLTSVSSRGTDTLTVDIYHSWRSLISTFNTMVGTSVTLMNTGFGSSAEETLKLGGQTTTFGPFSATVSEQLKTYTARISDPVIGDNTYVSVFGLGSPVGAFIGYHGGSPPAKKLPPTKPSGH